MRSCVFCEIVARRAPASFVAENADAVAFSTIGPTRSPPSCAHELAFAGIKHKRFSRKGAKPQRR